MIPSRALLHESAEVTVLEMTASMEAFAANEEWQRVEEISEKLRRALLQIPEYERREILLSVKRSTEEVQALAQSARHSVSEKLSGIQRGKDATRAYSAANGP